MKSTHRTTIKKLFRNLITLSLLVPILLQVSCATKKVATEELQKVKKAAVIAYTLNLPMPAKIGLDLGSGKLGASSGGSQIKETSETAKIIYEKINETLGKKLGWNMMPLEQMTKNPAYKEAYKDTMDGWQNKMPSHEGTQDYLVEDVMDKDGLRILKEEGRRKLLKALNVDLIIMAQVTTNLEGFAVMGIGARKPKTNIHIQAYNLKNEDLVWFDTLQGEKTEESVGMTGFFSEDKLTKLSVESAKSALSKIEKF